MRKLSLQNERGVAMMMALVTMFLLAIIAGEIVYQSGVYSSVVFRQRDQLQAELLARTGLRLALFQVRAAKKAKAKAKAMGLGDNASIVDQIWQTPLILPPPDIPGLAPSDLATLGEFRKSLGLDGTVSVNILGENGRMSINQLVWPPVSNDIKGVSQGGTCVDPRDVTKTIPCSQVPGLQPTNPGVPGQPNQGAEEAKLEAQKKIRDSYVELFNNMLEKRRQDDDAFRNKYPSLTGEIIVGNILAWASPSIKEDGNGRDKMDYYSRAEPSPYYPKNAPISSDSEYHMIEGLDETIAKMVRDNFTVQGTSSLDVNKASITLIHALIPELNADALDRLDKRRNDEALGGAFKDENDFWGYLTQLGNYDDAKKRFTERGIKILGATDTYHAVITAHVDTTNTNKTWLADIGPLPPKDANATATATATQAQPQTAGTTSTATNTSTTTAGADDYDSLSVVYLKAE